MTIASGTVVKFHGYPGKYVVVDKSEESVKVVNVSEILNGDKWTVETKNLNENSYTVQGKNKEALNKYVDWCIMNNNGGGNV